VLGTLRWAADQAAGHVVGRFTSLVMSASGRPISQLEWDLLMRVRIA
jgi:hypothetical protein